MKQVIIDLLSPTNCYTNIYPIYMCSSPLDTIQVPLLMLKDSIDFSEYLHKAPQLTIDNWNVLTYLYISINLCRVAWKRFSIWRYCYLAKSKTGTAQLILIGNHFRVIVLPVAVCLWALFAPHNGNPFSLIPLHQKLWQWLFDMVESKTNPKKAV